MNRISPGLGLAQAHPPICKTGSDNFSKHPIITLLTDLHKITPSDSDAPVKSGTSQDMS